MARIVLNPPANPKWGPNEGDSPERGDSWATVIAGINAMTAELYAVTTENFVLREDDSYVLREDGSKIIRN